MNQNDIAIKVDDVYKGYLLEERKTETIPQKIATIFRGLKEKPLPVLKGISFEVNKGEFFGIIGRNGAGKSTLIKLLSGALKPDKGTVNINGKTIRLSLGLGFDNNLTAYQNVKLNGSLIGLYQKEIKELSNEIFEFAGLEKFRNAPVKQFSSGMRARLGFAIAIYSRADILLMDEFFGVVGDQNFKEKANKAFHENLIQGRTIIHVSHNMSTIEKYCNRAMVLHNGKIAIVGSAQEAKKVYSEINNKSI